MLEIGEIRRGKEIGYKLGRSGNTHKWVWHACVDCGKERWVMLRRGQPESLRCPDCNAKMVGLRRRGEGHPNWKGGISRQRGYIQVRLQPHDPFYPMINRAGTVDEHRLVMAKHLGRCLKPWEIVHHKNHIKTDNRLENLQLVTADRHTQITRLEQLVKRLEIQVQLQVKQIRLLEWRIKQKDEQLLSRD